MDNSKEKILFSIDEINKIIIYIENDLKDLEERVTNLERKNSNSEYC